MAEEWRTDEPEVGTVARICYLDGTSLWVCVSGAAGEKWWVNDSGSELEVGTVGWLPITTPEEARLRAEVERLRDKLSQIQDYLVSEGLFESWMGYETEAGGADRE